MAKKSPAIVVAGAGIKGLKHFAGKPVQFIAENFFAL